MMTLTYILGAFILLGLCIFVHELGHLLGGKMVGIKARIFSMGYGKGVLKKKIGDTTYQVTLIPLGGYCQFYGEDPSEQRSGEGFEFLSAHPLKRIVTVAMGPVSRTSAIRQTACSMQYPGLYPAVRHAYSC